MLIADLVALENDTLRVPDLVYQDLRSKGVHFAPEVNAYVISSNMDVADVLRNGKRYSSVITVGNPTPKPTDVKDPNRLSPLLLLSDDPEHARRRSIVNRAFTPSRVAAWEPQITEIIDRYIAALRDKDDIDLVRDIAAPLPVRVISMLLGVPQGDVDQFRSWSETITSSLGGHSGNPEELAAVQKKFFDYISARLDEHDGVVGPDVLSIIAAAEHAGELNRRECVSFVVELLIAGNITTTHHLASSMMLLGREEGMFQTLREDPSLIPKFVEESLRMEAPIQGFYRLAMEDGEIGGVHIPEGSRLLVLYGSANYDPQMWEMCPHFKLDRPNGAAHMTFGKGAHACIGSSLARLESRLVLEALIESVDDYELTASPVDLPYLHSFINHGPLALPVDLRFRTPVSA
jgi:cytochrome P450